MLSSIVCGLIIVLNRLISSQCASKIQLEEPLNISSTTLDSRSKYRPQMDFIQNYLLQLNKCESEIENSTDVTGEKITNNTTKLPPNCISTNYDTPNNSQDIKNTSEKKRHNISTNLLPVIYSYRGETLPTHPRIPRKTPRKRGRINKQLRRRRNKNGARVFLLKPARYLLPPLITHRIEAIPELNFVTVISPYPSEYNSARDSSHHKENRNFDNNNTNATFSRKVFIPPPLQYLLPPFYEENEISYQYQTSEKPPSTTLTSENYDPDPISKDGEHYFNKQNLLDLNKSNENEFRIIEPSNDQNNKSFQEATSTFRSTPNDVINSFADDYTTEDYIFQKPDVFTDEEKPTDDYYHPESYSTERLTTVFENYYTNKTIQEENYAYNSKKLRIQVDPNLNIRPTSDSFITSEGDNFSRKETTTFFPVITGRNIEKELFESGQFQSFDTTIEPTVVTHEKAQIDLKLSMFNKPLLSEEVAKAGMKILVSNENSTDTDKWQDVRQSSRGRYKYRHFNQFQFDNKNGRHIKNSRQSASSGRGRSLQLSVAETSYFNNRPSSVQQKLEEREVQVIPGIPGKDYPTLTKPPTTRNFSCKNLAGGRGYYGDASTGCQVFYVCVGDGAGEPMLCPNGTLFSQDFLVCDWWYNVDCRQQNV